MQGTPEARPSSAEEIFFEAAQLAPEDRAGYLDCACGSDPGLRQEVESMLSFDCSASRDLADVVGGTAASMVRAESYVGRRFGAYVATETIGSGGMGTVYRAVRADDQIRQQVAIKLVKSGLDNAGMVARFYHERQILATLDHPFIGKLFDAGTTEDGLPFFVMEFIQGGAIDVYAKERGLSVAGRCELFRKVCEAVACAHRNLVIHRDLKPSNILVTDGGDPKLLDFGIAKILTPGTASQTVYGATGMMLALTPDYASPEQVRGEPVNTATDVYSLGAVLYELLTGAKPHRLTTYTAPEIEQAVCLREIVPPSAAAPEADRRAIAGDLDNIVLMAMRKEPGRRYHSVEQFSEDLRRYLAGLPVMAREDTLAYRAGKFLRRHRLGAAAAVLVFLSMAGGATAAAWEAHRARAQQHIAEERLSQIATLANTTLIDIHAELERLQGANDARKRMVETTLSYLDGLSRSTGGDPKILDVLSTAYMRMGDVQGLPDHPNLGDTKGAEGSYRKSLAVAREAVARQPESAQPLATLTDIEERLGMLLSRTGKSAEAREHVQAAVSAAEKQARLAPKSYDSRNLLGSAYMQMAFLLASPKPAEALTFAQKALAVTEPLRQIRPEDYMLAERLSDIHSMLGRVYYFQNRVAEALPEYQQAAEIRGKLVAARPNDRMMRRELMLAYAHIADAFGNPWGSNLNRTGEARRYYTKAAEIAEAIAKTAPERLARHDLANALLRLGLLVPTPADLPDALRSLRRAAGIVEELAAQDAANKALSTDLATIYETTGARLADLKRRSEAMAYYRKSLAIARGVVAQDPGDIGAQTQVLVDQHGLAGLLAAAGDSAGAVQLERDSVAAADRLIAAGMTAPRFHVYAARTRGWLGQTWRGLGNRAAACEAFGESLDQWKKLAPLPSPTLRAEMHSAETAAGACAVDIHLN